MSCEETGERRGAVRVTEPGLTGRLPYRRSADLVDISVSGVGLLAPAAMSTISTYRVIVRGAAELQCSGRVLWNRVLPWDGVLASGQDSGAKPPVRSGLEFTEQEASLANEVLQFIQNHGPEERAEAPRSQDAHPDDPTSMRRATRYRLTNSTSLSLATDFSYRVRSASLTGMLIESPVSLPAGAEIAAIVQVPPGEIRSRARVVRSGPESMASETQGDGRFLSAIAFFEMSQDDRFRLEEYLKLQLEREANG